MGEQTFEERMDAEVAAMAAAAGIGREEGGAPPPGPVILSTRDFLDTFPASDWDQKLAYHGVDAYQPELLTKLYPRAAPAEDCGSPWRTVRGCRCKVAVVRDHCDRISCSSPTCEDRNRHRRAGQVFRRLEHVREGGEVIYSVFTVPPSRRLEAASEKTWRKWTRSLISYLKKHHGLRYAVERSDPAGEDGEKWHPHINLLWIRKSGKGWTEEADLEAIRARWRKIVGMHPEDTVNLRMEYSADVPKLRHWASYMGRTWARWAKANKYMIRVKWFGRPPKPEEEVGDGCCKECGEEVAVIRTGSTEAAEALVTLGYDALLAEHRERIAELRRMGERRRPVEFRKVEVVIDARR